MYVYHSYSVHQPPLTLPEQGSPIGSGNSAGNGNGNGNGSGNKASADGNTLNGISIGSVGDILPDIVLPQEINVSPSISL